MSQNNYINKLEGGFLDMLNQVQECDSQAHVETKRTRLFQILIFKFRIILGIVVLSASESGQQAST